MDWILLFVNACAPYDSVNRKCISLHRVDMHEFHPRIGRSVNIMLKFKHLFRTTQLRINIFNVLMYFCMLPKIIGGTKVNFMVIYVYLNTTAKARELHVI